MVDGVELLPWLLWREEEEERERREREECLCVCEAEYSALLQVATMTMTVELRLFSFLVQYDICSNDLHNQYLTTFIGSLGCSSKSIQLCMSIPTMTHV